MGSRIGSHQLSNGLFVSGQQEPQLKDRQPSRTSRAVPYTGGDVRESGELGRMCGVGDHVPKVLSRPPSVSIRSGPNSGQLGPKPTNSGPLNKKSSSFSGPISPIQPTGLITSGPLGSSNSNRRSGQLDIAPARSSFSKNTYGSAVTNLAEAVKLEYNFPRVAIWACVTVLVMGLVVGAFLLVSVKKPVLLIAVGALLFPAALVVTLNRAYKKRGVLKFLRNYPNAELRGAKDGQHVKISGVVTCGNTPLETSFKRIQRCVYTSSELHEYRGFCRKQANDKQRMFSWGCRHSEKYVSDFYISDSQSGLRALVKAGYGAKVSTFVKQTTIADVTKDNKNLSPNFARWLSDRGLSSNGHVMHLKEGCVKEGSSVSVMGVIRCQDNMVMITPPPEPISTSCLWPCLLFPVEIEGLILMSDDNEDGEAIPV